MQNKPAFSELWSTSQDGAALDDKARNNEFNRLECLGAQCGRCPNCNRIRTGFLIDPLLEEFGKNLLRVIRCDVASSAISCRASTAACRATPLASGLAARSISRTCQISADASRKRSRGSAPFLFMNTRRQLAISSATAQEISRSAISDPQTAGAASLPICRLAYAR